MSVKLKRPTKPEESQRDSNFNGKTIPYPGFKPGTSGLAVGSHKHCIKNKLGTVCTNIDERTQKSSL
jgi:hypothetical protein